MFSRIESLKKIKFPILEWFHFTLRGAAGNEQVTLKHGKGTRTFTLSDEAQGYSAFGKTITIECQNSDGAMIYFECFKKVKIRDPNWWGAVTQEGSVGWSCDDLNNENDGDKLRCNRVREGNFNWNSIYEITFTGLPGNIIA